MHVEYNGGVDGAGHIQGVSILLSFNLPGRDCFFML